ncbi:MAG: ABC-type multidrug transport system, ATPase component [Haloquadratum sp. J07HQX50]|nr:MAG: ABC-type multidrug transport system, ATPase component [Haloquadratum sp. J07HQX50]
MIECVLILMQSQSASAQTALSVTALSKQFGRGETAIQAVDDVSFEINSGEIVGLLGPNGAGKTTLIKSILGTIIPDEGGVNIYGHSVADATRQAYADVDVLFEGARNDYWRLTVRENLRYFATISGVHPDSVSKEHDRLLEQFELAAEADTPVRSLSRGMKQKVSLASVLASGARLLILDEPTLGLDVAATRTLRRELQRLASDTDRAIILSSHDMTVIESLCNRVLLFVDGDLRADTQVESLLNSSETQHVELTASPIDSATQQRLSSCSQLVEQGDTAVRLRTKATTSTLCETLNHLEMAGASIKSIETTDPDLESVFVELTSDDS